MVDAGWWPDAGLPDAGFVPVSVSSAVAKVKDLLVGLPPTDAEVQAVTADQSALTGLVAQWMTMPEYQDKMLQFFITQFQQNELTFPSLTMEYFAQAPFTNNQAQFVQMLEESFGRTVMELIAEGQPFTSVLTTRQFMMTPALMAAYATLDDIYVNDIYVESDEFQLPGSTSVTLESSTQVPIDQAIDPTSSSYMTFYDPTIANSYGAGCPTGTVVYPAPVDVGVLENFLLDFVPAEVGQTNCIPPMIPSNETYLTSSDFTSWEMVTIRQPNPGESTTQLYDLPSMRAGNDLVLNIPRVSFFTTPAFFGRWQTNQSNLARVLLNQTLIVALGEPVDLTNTTQPASLAALDTSHATPGTACYSCHQSLDPMRQFFRQAYTLYGHQQEDPTETSLPGQFAFHGVSATGTGIADLGTLLASHPMFGPAWVQKLCTYATSTPCDPNDPEFQRLVSVFEGSSYSWNALVKALFASPIVTGLQQTVTADTSGQTFPIARQEHLCALLSNRLGVTDLCALDVGTVPFSPVTREVAATWPSDQYSRGSATPVLANQPSLFIRGGMESICADLAQRFVDVNASYESSDPTTAIQNLATNLMGLTSDRASGAEQILQQHFASAEQMGASASDSLKSTFILACMSPYVVGIGQ